MEHNPENRMAAPKNRGRPIPSTTTPLPEPVQHVDVPQGPLAGIICPCCGRGMVPRRDRTQESKCYARCTLCSGRMLLTFRPDGRYDQVRRVP